MSRFGDGLVRQFDGNGRARTGDEVQADGTVANCGLRVIGATALTTATGLAASARPTTPETACTLRNIGNHALQQIGGGCGMDRQDGRQCLSIRDRNLVDNGQARIELVPCFA